MNLDLSGIVLKHHLGHFPTISQPVSNHRGSKQTEIDVLVILDCEGVLHSPFTIVAAI